MSIRKFSIISLIILFLSVSTVSAEDFFNDLQDLIDNNAGTLDLVDDFNFQSIDSKEGITIHDEILQSTETTIF